MRPCEAFSRACATAAAGADSTVGANTHAGAVFRAAEPGATPEQPGDAGPLYRWHWRARLPERHGQVFRVLARGKLNACLVQFLSDGSLVVTSRNALRRA